jgi:hypothetical protein
MSKLFPALEELENQGAEVAASAPISEAELADAQAADEVEAIGSEMDAVNDAVVNGETGAAELEKFEEIVEKSVESGEGMSPETAEAVQVGLETIANRLGLPAGASSFRMPSLESFSGTSGRVASSRVALEGIGEMGKKVWNAIKRLAARFKELWFKFVNAIKKLYNNRIGHIESVIAKAKELKKKGAKLKKGKDEVQMYQSLQTVVGSEDFADTASDAVFGEGNTPKETADAFKSLVETVTALKSNDEVKASQAVDEAVRLVGEAKVRPGKIEYMDQSIEVTERKTRFSLNRQVREVGVYDYTSTTILGEKVKVKTASLDDVIVTLEAARKALREVPIAVDTHLRMIEQVNKIVAGELKHQNKEAGDKGLSEAGMTDIIRAVDFVTSQTIRQMRMFSQLVAHGAMRAITCSKLHLACYEEGSVEDTSKQSDS